MPDKMQELLNIVEEVIDGGDWPSEAYDPDYVLNLVNDVRDGELAA